MSKENLLLIEEVLDAEKSKEDRQIILEGLKDQIKEFEKDADADFQEEIDRVKSKFGIGGAKKKTTPKVEKRGKVTNEMVEIVDSINKKGKKSTPKTTKKPRAKTTPEQKAKNREKVQNATGKTIEECKEILAKYEALRGKTTQKDKQRVEKLKDEDKIIDGTNVKTADAITETTAKQVPKKIKQEVDAIEKEAEKEAKEEVNSSKGNKLPYDEWFKFWDFSIDKKTYYYVASSKDGKVWASDEKKSEVVKMLKDFYSENIKEIHPYMFSSKGSNRSETKEGKKEVEKIKIEKIEEKVKDMTKDLADKSSELIKAMSKTISDLSPSKDEVRKFLLDIRGQVDVLLKAYKFGGAVQSYNVTWMGGQPMPSYAKGGKVEFETKLIKGYADELKDYTHFAIHKPTNSIAGNWDYKEYDRDELMENKEDYFFIDLKDDHEGNVDKFKKSDFAIITRSGLKNKGIDLNNYNVFYGQKYSKGGKFADGKKPNVITDGLESSNVVKIQVSKGRQLENITDLENVNFDHTLVYDTDNNNKVLFSGDYNKRALDILYELEKYAKGGKFADGGRYSILGVSKSSLNEKPTLHSSVNNRSEIKKAVAEAKKDFKELTNQEHDIFVTDNEEDRQIYNYSKGGSTYGGDGEEYIYPSEEERIDEMAKHWNSEGWASSSVSKQGDDGEFFDKIGVDSDEVGITSQTGNDIIYYDVNRPSYFNRDFAKGGRTTRAINQDRARLSKEKHEQAYKPKRKGSYRSFEMGGEVIEEWSIVTDNEEEHFDNEEDARDFWNSLSNEEKESGQFFRKVWEDGEETDVDLLYAKGGRTTRGYHQDRARLSKEKHEQAYKSKRKGKYSSFEMGGKTMIDEEFSNVPEELEEVFGMYNEDEETYSEMKRLKGIANQRGYDFDYGLDGEPTEFWEINKMAKGGKIAQIDEILSSTDDSKKYRKLANIRGKLLHKIRLNDNDVKYLEDNGIDTYSFAKGGKTWVQDVVDSPNFREGAFTRKAEARGMSTDAFMNQVLHSPNLYDERTRKQAQFMKNAFND